MCVPAAGAFHFRMRNTRNAVKHADYQHICFLLSNKEM
ncbi:hypothetical protein MuYL_0320 [Mucilaginibacter xinganensis]|uniref:Uncharacterized protein n=1 Tax=Mucilaginibacter xinganensis TaxID=1234841 RepID=A0A223NQS4_9SPHI|nr:hypothetical protein MuYL_0320 [Mucilaginibacter xinganensis]